MKVWVCTVTEHGDSYSELSGDDTQVVGVYTTEAKSDEVTTYLEAKYKNTENVSIRDSFSVKLDGMPCCSFELDD